MRRVVDVDQAEALREAVGPLEVVGQAPVEIAFQRDARGGGAGGLAQMVEQVAGALRTGAALADPEPALRLRCRMRAARATETVTPGRSRVLQNTTGYCKEIAVYA